ncbi:MAG: response regulator [Hydrocarboniphaga sp.]|uniref:hybrid sensor histidine kinase/response regulator n=1 Tax=Hydrocarboniphaga sp. TaxID=2033016 RepID=UPI00262E197D|nr:response regulator [Hydrocarboniphaga sp.]MDB5971970.1 response regulator [Hydrocarboniphaga sp.]
MGNATCNSTYTTTQGAPMSDDKPRILLVDDQPARLLSYEAILGDLPLTLVRANSGEEALHRLMAGEFAVILLDVNMPGMDGFETASLIHQHPRFEKTPIIFVTGVHVTDLDQLRGYKLGAFDYVYIPVVPEILRSKITVLVELYNHRRELQHLNQSLANANLNLEQAYTLLRNEKTRELQALNATLEQANTTLEHTNRTLQAESHERGLAEERMRFLADTIPSIVWTCAPDGAVTYANRNWHDYYGIAAPGVTPAYLTRMALHADEAEVVFRYVSDSLAAGRAFEFEARHLGSDGSYSWFITRAVPWRDARGEVASWFGITTNINEQKQMMERLRDSDRRKDEFLAILGHELRNPLAPIRNAVEVMRLIGLPSGPLQTMRDMIDRQVNQLTRLVDDLLDVSRITRGKIELLHEELTLAEVLERAIEVCRPQLEARELTLQLTLPQAPLPIQGDVTRLAQVFGNLLNNAAKYSPVQRPVEIEAAAVDGDALVIVRDRGVGIPPEMLERIFQPFTQVEATRGYAQGGLGIGLALVRQLLELHGGRVEAHSEGLGLGSEFRVRLPLSLPQPGTAPVVEPEAQTAACGLRRVLIADDNADAAASLALMLRLQGHEVQIAGDGVEALELAGRQHPDVVLLDLGMPRMDGYETASRLRAAPWGRELLLVALTGWSQGETSQRPLADFDAHRVKPIAPEDLAALLALRPEIAAA